MGCNHHDGEHCCERPERLKGRPEECTPEQIRECHGETAEEHPCASTGKRSKGQGR